MTETTGVNGKSTKAASKREELRRKVEASQAELETRRSPEYGPPDGVRALAMDYPFALLAGSVVLGALVGVVLPRSPGRKLAGRVVTLATIAGELGMAYGRQAMEKASDTAGVAAEKLEDLREDIGGTAADYSKRAGGLISMAGKIASEALHDVARTALEASEAVQDKVQDAARTTQKSTREAGMKIGRQAIRLRSHIRH